jgi:uncharacterized protein YcbX
LWRYPVKSMAGEQLNTAEVTASGVRGDRAYALVDAEDNKVATAKSTRKWPDILRFAAQFERESGEAGAAPPARITFPDGRTASTAQSDIEQLLSSAFGRKVTIMAQAPDGLLLEFPEGTLGGDYASATEIPIAGGAPPGTFFDYAAMHLVTTTTLESLQKRYPQGTVDVRRFRPNLVVDTGVTERPFPENDWVGRTISIGDEVQLRVMIACPRCVMTTLPQSTLPHDAGMLRAIAECNRLDLDAFGKLPCVGVYAQVTRTGFVRKGDKVAIA